MYGQKNSRNYRSKHKFDKAKKKCKETSRTEKEYKLVFLERPIQILRMFSVKKKIPKTIQISPLTHKHCCKKLCFIVLVQFSTTKPIIRFYFYFLVCEN